MFGLLKKKLSNFSEKLKHKIKEEPPKEKITQEEVKELPVNTISKEELINENKEKKIDKNKKENITKEEKLNPLQIKKEIKETITLNQSKEEVKTDSTKPNEKKETIIQTEKNTENPILKENKIQIEKEHIKKNKPVNIEEKSKEENSVKNAYEDKRELKAKIGKTSKLKSIFSGKILIEENKISDLLWELELSLLESDVEQETATEIIEQIKKRLVGQNVSIRTLDEFLKIQIKEILTEMMSTTKINLLNEIKNNQEPYVIMVLGPNGAGKTTSIAKLTHYFKNEGLTSLWAAADTFRSGAIDQLQEHANNLSTKIIKQQYGADPAAVAFDAIKSAKANNVDVVMIDTAGRQETNKNLMEELKKIERVAKPNLKIYVGESYTGQGLLSMAEEFNQAIGIDGFILSKIDADAKGGTTISLLYKLKKPILYVGTGQEYEDLKEFNPEFILDRII